MESQQNCHYEDPRSILVVEDDELFRRSLVTFLSSLGYRPLSAGSAEEALAKVVKQRVDALVTDLHLPEMDGIELVRALHVRGITVPVILISGSPGEEVQENAREACIEVVLRKPADLSKLEAKLAALLGPGNHPAS